MGKKKSLPIERPEGGVPSKKVEPLLLPDLSPGKYFKNPIDESSLTPDPEKLITEQIKKLNEEYAVRSADLRTTLQTLQDSGRVKQRKVAYLDARAKAIAQDNLQGFLSRSEKDEEFTNLSMDVAMRQTFINSIVSWADRYVTTKGGLDADQPELCANLLAMAKSNNDVGEKLEEMDDEIFYYFRAQERAYGEPPPLSLTKRVRSGEFIPMKYFIMLCISALIFSGFTTYVVLSNIDINLKGR